MIHLSYSTVNPHRFTDRQHITAPILTTYTVGCLMMTISCLRRWRRFRYWAITIVTFRRLVPSKSPSQPLLGLPGVDTDDDLFLIEYAIGSSSPVSKADNLPLELPSKSLLLIGGPQEVSCVCSSDLPTEGSHLFDTIYASHSTQRVSSLTNHAINFMLFI